MKKNINLICLCLMLLFVFVIVLFTNIKILSLNVKENNIILALFILILILVLSFRTKKDNNYLKNTSVRTVIMFLMLFMVVTYGLGIILGFNRSFFTINIKQEIKNILPVLLITVEVEFLRKLILTNIFNNKKIFIIFTLLISFLLVLKEINIGALTTESDKFIFLCIIILPILSQEFLCSYITYKISWIPSLIFKLVMSLYIYIIPIVPDLGDYIYSVFNIILPFLIYNSLNKIVLNYEKVKQELKKTNQLIVSITLATFLIIIIMLVSGVFKYKMVSIASNSMKPAFSRGDAIIYSKINTENLIPGDVIAFEKNNVIITHRIVKIWRKGDVDYYITKGDNNDAIDTFNPAENDVLGKVKWKIKYLGYPTILLSELFERR